MEAQEFSSGPVKSEMLMSLASGDIKEADKQSKVMGKPRRQLSNREWVRPHWQLSWQQPLSPSQPGALNRQRKKREIWAELGQQAWEE